MRKVLAAVVATLALVIVLPLAGGQSVADAQHTQEFDIGPKGWFTGNCRWDGFFSGGSTIIRGSSVTNDRDCSSMSIYTQFRDSSGRIDYHSNSSSSFSGGRMVAIVNNVTTSTITPTQAWSCGNRRCGIMRR